ncbi:MAG: hypothetical protein ACOX66_01745 [Oscillospiraceae bacterium]|jgi:hypothetical protein
MDETNAAPQRGFRTPEQAMSGRGAVFERGNTRENWPYSLGDYLKAYVGRRMRVGCVLPNGHYFEKAGELATVGTDFIALRGNKPGGLVLIDLAAVRGVEIL